MANDGSDDTASGGQKASDAAQSPPMQPIKPPDIDASEIGRPVPNKPEDHSSGVSGDKGRINQQDFVDRITASDRWMIRLTAALVIVGFLQFGTSVFQWLEMKSAGTDSGNLVTATRNLVTAYNAQNTETDKIRTATENFAAAMRREADNTSALASATRDSAEATKNAATAQNLVAQVASTSAQPFLEPEIMTLSGFKGAVNKDGTFWIKSNWYFTNVGSGRLDLKDMTLSLDRGKEPPDKPNYAAPWPLFISVPPGHGFGPAVDSFFRLSPNDVADILAKRQFPFIVGFIDYTDALRKPHRQCFGYFLQIDGSNSTTGFYTVTKAAYRCNK